MIDTTPVTREYGTTSVEESLDEWGKPILKIKSPKFKQTFTVRKSNNGFSFFEVAVQKGKVPKEIGGTYTTLYKAQDALLSYIDRSKESLITRRDKTYEENHKAK